MPKTGITPAALMHGAGLCCVVVVGGSDGASVLARDPGVLCTGTLSPVTSPSRGPLPAGPCCPLSAVRWGTVRGTRGWDGWARTSQNAGPGSWGSGPAAEKSTHPRRWRTTPSVGVRPSASTTPFHPLRAISAASWLASSAPSPPLSSWVRPELMGTGPQEEHAGQALGRNRSLPGGTAWGHQEAPWPNESQI